MASPRQPVCCNRVQHELEQDGVDVATAVTTAACWEPAWQGAGTGTGFVFLLEPACYFAGSSFIFCYNRLWSFSLLNLLLLEPAHIFAGSWYFFATTIEAFFAGIGAAKSYIQHCRRWRRRPAVLHPGLAGHHGDRDVTMVRSDRRAAASGVSGDEHDGELWPSPSKLQSSPPELQPRVPMLHAWSWPPAGDGSGDHRRRRRPTARGGDRR
ncbi:hypothetical protein ACQJBY_071349 [Aegilops geniculata]